MICTLAIIGVWVVVAVVLGLLWAGIGAGLKR